MTSRGFTLVEMLIAMLLFFVVSMAIFASVTVIGRAQANAQGVDAAQAGVRAALELVSRDVAMASAGASSGTMWFGSGTPAQAAAVRVTDSATGPDSLDLLLIDSSASATVVALFGAGQTAIAVDNNAAFKAGDLIQISDLVTATQLRVTGLATGTPMAIVVAAPDNPLPRSYPPGSWVFRARAVSYYVDATQFGAADPMLMMDPDGPLGPLTAQPMVEGIEDFQVALGFDLDGDGQLRSVGDAAGDDEWIGNVAGETPPASLASLKAVRLTIVARTISAHAGLIGQRPTAENHPGALSLDGYPRRVLRSEIAVRNFNL